MTTLNTRTLEEKSASAQEWAAWPRFAGIPEVDANRLVPPGRRAVIIAPHSDDEILGCGGLLAQLAELGRRVLLVSVTRGEFMQGIGSQPVFHVSTLPESREAIRRLSLESVDICRLDFPDGLVSSEEQRLGEQLGTLLRPTDVVFAAWQQDGHPDHEATGRAASFACATSGARCIEVPLWAWQWLRPGDERFPWERARRLPLDEATLAAKRYAVEAFNTSTRQAPEPILPQHVLTRLFRPWEIFLL